MLKKILQSLGFTFVAILIFAGSVSAFDPAVYISDLAQYTRTDSFYLSYSALANDPGSITAQFYVKKEGGSYSPFGNLLTGASGRIQVTSSQMNENNKTYYFKVVLNTGESDETETTFDNSAPGSVSGYGKDLASPGLYKLHWRNPSDSDFSRVFIYRSDSANFTADGSTKIAERGGAPDAEVTYEDNSGLDPNKTYYYALRAIDNAGNASGVVADAEATVTAGQVEGASTTNTGPVTILPKTQANGQVLGEESSEATSSPSPEVLPSTLGEKAQVANNFLTSVAGKILVGGFLALIGAYLIFRGRRNY